MTTPATVNYHIHKPERQAFELDAGGIVGNLVSPELAATQVRVLDERTAKIDMTFDGTSVEFTAMHTDVDVLDDERTWRPVYEADIQRILKTKLDIEDVIIFDHTVRIDDDRSNRKPARNVHSDYSIDGAQQRLIDLLGEEQALQWAKGHYAFINVWRPVDEQINSSPLGFILPDSVDEQDWILLDLIYPDRKGQILGLAANPAHQWVYRSKMRPDEVAFFNIFDNQGLPSIAHSALDMIENPAINTVRKSIESRTLVRYRDCQSSVTRPDYS
ncbi:MAG: CmcJ/NvfI family oxidoreductase [Granulosicoccus sp.]